MRTHPDSSQGHSVNQGTPVGSEAISEQEVLCPRSPHPPPPIPVWKQQPKQAEKCPFLKVIGNQGEQPGELKASSPWVSPPAPIRVLSLPSSAQSELGRRGSGHRGNQTLVRRPAASAPGPGRPRVVMVELTSWNQWGDL